MRWDTKKKKYVLKKVDREGRVITEKKNEAGQKITKKMKEKQKDHSIYKKWQQRTHLSLQKSGEMEDTKAIDQAKRATEARKTLKDFKQRHGSNLFKGEDAKSHKTLVDKKKQKLLNKMKDDYRQKKTRGRDDSQKKNQGWSK